jgi:hypothetical protein
VDERPGAGTPTRRHPWLVESAGVRPVAAPDDTFELGLEWLLDGMAATLGE